MSEAAAASFLDELEALAAPARLHARRRRRRLPASSACCGPRTLLHRALVVGWNEASLRKALDGSPPALSDAGGLVAELARLPAADVRIAAPLAPAGAPLWPWRRLLAEPRSSDAGIEVRVALEGAGA
jgi:hypothetical protein